MNNRNWVALFFGLASLVLLVGVVSVSGTMGGNGRNNTTAPQQINQNMMTTQPKDGKLPTEINTQDIMNNGATPNANGVLPNTGNMQDMNNENADKENNDKLPKLELPKINR